MGRLDLRSNGAHDHWDTLEPIPNEKALGAFDIGRCGDLGGPMGSQHRTGKFIVHITARISVNNEL